MVDQALTILDTVKDQLYAIFVMPGSLLLAWFTSVAPAKALSLGITGGQSEGLLVNVLSLFAWLLLAMAATAVLKVFRNGLRLANAIVRTTWFRMTIAISAMKTSLLLKLRSLLGQRGKLDHPEPRSVDFDEWDMAVLDSISEQGPGFTLSAPELAVHLSMRPSQIQARLEKLSHYKMLDSVIGSTDGYDNYRLTETGATFVSVWQRQERLG